MRFLCSSHRRPGIDAFFRLGYSRNIGVCRYGFCGVCKVLKNKKFVGILGVAAALFLGIGTIRAEDTRHKWQFGFGVSFFATEDDIRSDADLQGCTGTGLNLTCGSDPRLDKNLLNEASINDDLRFDFSVSYGFTRWFALELGASYFEGDIGPMESFHAFQNFNVFTGIFGPEQRSSSFNTVGNLTEIPLQLSALIRFRPHAPFDPYIGFGVGYVFTDLETSDAFTALEQQINALQLTDVNAPFGFDGVVAFDPAHGLPESLQSEIGLPKASDWVSALITDPLVITVNDGSTFHIRGGADYYFTEHFSMYIDGTYTWADPSVQIRILDQPLGAVTVQANFLEAGAAGLGADGFPGPWVDARGLSSQQLSDRMNAGLCWDVPNSTPTETHCQSEFLDACRDSAFSGVNSASASLQLSECFGEDLNNNFRVDPGEDLGANGFLDRTFGVCIENCTCNPSDPSCKPLWVENENSTIPVFIIDCLDGQDNELVFQIPGRNIEYVNIVPGGQFTLQNADDPVATNTFIIQGGDIDLEGFSIGVGVKFTF